jgi:Initiator Replication protein
MKLQSRTVEQKTSTLLGFPKPGEFIEMTGTHMLEASDRAVFNLLYQNAHDSGRLLDPAAEWEMPLNTLRSALSRHDNNARLRETLMRLKGVSVSVSYVDEDGEPRVIITGLFDFFDVPAKDLSKRPTLRYGLPRKLAPMLERSGRWGRIRAEIVCSMTSKYAIALYELVQLKANMDRCVEVFSADRLRELLGVPPGNYERVDNLMRKVIDPAVLQVNGLSDMSVAIEQRRRHSRAPVHEFTLTWWKKHGEEFQVAMRERNRSKVGRMARLRGEVDKVEALEREQEEAAHAELAKNPVPMRRQDADEPVS